MSQTPNNYAVMSLSSDIRLLTTENPIKQQQQGHPSASMRKSFHKHHYTKLEEATPLHDSSLSSNIHVLSYLSSFHSLSLFLHFPASAFLAFCFSAHFLLAILPCSAASALAFLAASSFSFFAFSRSTISTLVLPKTSLPFNFW